MIGKTDIDNYKMTNINRIFFVVLLMATAICANAQNGVNSPYSRYGFGMLSDRSMGFNKGMGGVAQGFREGSIVNVQNPAAYSEVDSLTALFDFGLTLQNGNYKMGNVQKNIRNTSIDYFAMHFRGAKNLGVAVGILPISNIKYNFSSLAENLEGTENVSSSYTFSGDGGLHEVFLGAAWRPIKPISVGLNVAYVYGDYSHDMRMAFSDNSAYSINRTYDAEIRTYSADFGIQYIQPIGKNDKFVLGGTYTLGHNVNNNAYCSTQTLNNLSTNIIQTHSTDTIKNAFELPSSYAVGATYYHSNKLRVGVDAELQKWGSCKFPNHQSTVSTESNGAYTSTTGQLNDRKKLAIGADYTPNLYGRSYLSRMTYKIGAYYSNSYAKADLTGKVTDKPTEFGISAGVTLPISNRNLWYNSPRVNVAVQWVHTNIPYLNTASMRQAALTENYIKLHVGITFSERWFFKWKVQ